MGAHGQHIDFRILRTERQLSECLDRVRMEIGLRVDLLDHGTDMGNVFNGAHLVVDPHGAHQDRIGTDRGPERFLIDHTLMVDAHDRDLISQGFEELERLVYGRMLDIGADNVPAVSLPCKRGADERGIVALGAAGVEYDLRRPDLEAGRDLFGSCLQILLGMHAENVARGRVAVVLEHDLIHQLDDLGADPGRRSVIKVYLFHICNYFYVY